VKTVEISDILHRVAATTAFHNSKERFDSPKCHPKRRWNVSKCISSAANDQQELKRAVSISAKGMCQISSISPDLFFVSPLADGSFPLFWPLSGLGCPRYTENSKCCNRFLTENFRVLLLFCTPCFCIDSVTCSRSAELIPASVNFYRLIWTDSSIIRQCALGKLQKMAAD